MCKFFYKWWILVRTKNTRPITVVSARQEKFVDCGYWFKKWWRARYLKKLRQKGRCKKVIKYP